MGKQSLTPDQTVRSVTTTTRGRRLNRRTLVKGAAAFGAYAATLGTPLLGRAQTPSAWTRKTKIVSWGFNTEPTNPLAAARVEAFRKAYPTIELEIVPELDQQKILTAAVSDTLPDLLWLGRFSIASYAARGRVLQPLDEFIQRDGYDLSRFYEAGLKEATYQGQLYGLPGGMDLQVLYVNLDALAEVGITDPSQLDTSNWDQLSELGPQLLQREGDVIRRWGFDHKTQDGFMYLWGIGNGGTFMNEDATEATFNHPQNIDALAWAYNASEAQGGFQQYDAVRSSWQGDEQFARGQVAMTMYQSWMLGIISRTNPDLNFAVLPIRRRGQADSMVSIVGGNAWCITAGANDPEAAWEFIKFMHTDDTWLIGARAVKAAREAEGQPYIPSLTGTTTADQLQIEQLYEPLAPKFDDAVRLFPELLSVSDFRPVAQSPVSQELDTILHETGVLPALRGDATPEEALNQAQEEAQEAIEEFE